MRDHRFESIHHLERRSESRTEAKHTIRNTRERGSEESEIGSVLLFNLVLEVFGTVICDWLPILCRFRTMIYASLRSKKGCSFSTLGFRPSSIHCNLDHDGTSLPSESVLPTNAEIARVEESIYSLEHCSSEKINSLRGLEVWDGML